MSREERQLETGRHADLVEDAGQMVLDGVFADGKLRGDFLVAESGDHVRDDHQLARGETESCAADHTPVASGAAGGATAAISQHTDTQVKDGGSKST